MKNRLIKAYAFEKMARVYVADTTELVQRAKDIHDLWPTASAALGRFLTSSVIMGAMYKGAFNRDDAELTLRLDANGPLGGMVATTNTHGEVRGYVGNPHVFLQYDSGKLNVGKAVGEGHLHITKNLKIRDIFTSSVPLFSGEIAEDFAYYFRASEQIPSVVSLGVKVNENNDIIAAGGIILQMLPGYKEHHLQAVEKAFKDLPHISFLIEEGKSPEDILSDITDDFQLLEEIPVKYQCDCNRDKFERGLMSLGIEELQRLIVEDGKIETNCHFCDQKYVFDDIDVNNLILELKK
jgi:molecular chaperone Hsp33